MKTTEFAQATHKIPCTIMGDDGTIRQEELKFFTNGERYVICVHVEPEDLKEIQATRRIYITGMGSIPDNVVALSKAPFDAEKKEV